MHIEGSEDKYREGTREYAAWIEGREAYMGNDNALEHIDDLCPYYQPHDARLRKAWVDGVMDEAIHKLDSTGR